MYRRLILSIAILCGLAVPAIASAAVVYSQPDGGSISTSTIGLGYAGALKSDTFIAGAAYDFNAGGYVSYMGLNIEDNPSNHYIICLNDVTTGNVPVICSSDYEGSGSIDAVNVALLPGSVNEGGVMIPGNTYWVGVYEQASGGLAAQYLGDLAGHPAVEIGTGSSTPPTFNTTTRIITVTPSGNSTTSTSTTATIGATGYIRSSDYESGTYLQIKYARNSDYQASVANPDAIFTTVTVPISSAGNFVLSTTTSITRVGQYTMVTQILTPSFTNNVLNFFGLGQFATFGILSATTTTFTAATSTGYDIFVAQTTADLIAYYAASGITWDSCNPVSIPPTFSPKDCFQLLFVPQMEPLSAAWGNFRDGFLSYFPWGYMTRFVVIMNGTATSSLPSFTADVQIGEHATTSLTFDMQDTIQGGADLLDSIPATNGAGNIRDIMEPWVKLIVALLVVYVIVTDLTRMPLSNHDHHNGRE